MFKDELFVLDGFVSVNSGHGGFLELINVEISIEIKNWQMFCNNCNLNSAGI